MKNATWIFVLLAASAALCAYGQDAKVNQDGKPAQDAKDSKGSQALLESTSAATKAKEEKKAEMPRAKATNEVLGTRVVYGGYFTDFVRAERKRSLFDLSAPLSPKKDLENLSLYPGTEQAHTQKIYNSPVVVLFSIKH
jgi:hypothetical protein